METEKILDILERIELQLKAVWWDNLLFWLWLMFLGLAVFSAVIKSVKMAVVMGITFIFLNIFFQFAEKKEMKKIRREYEKARKEIPAQQERDMQNL